MKTSSGFIRIIIFLVIAIMLLLISGIDVRSIIDSIDVTNFITNSQDFAQDFYVQYLKQPLSKFVIRPAIVSYGYIKLYVVDAIIDLIQQSTA